MFLNQLVESFHCVCNLGKHISTCRTKLTRYEAKSLVALLHSKDSEVLQKTLTTIGNHGTFEDNQVSTYTVVVAC